MSDKSLKRSTTGVLSQFIKQRDTLLSLGLGSSVFLLNGCSEDAYTYRNLSECKRTNTECPEQCESAYKLAEQDAALYGPSYRTLADCESDFGDLYCGDRNSENHYRARMAGFAMQCDDDDHRYYGGSGGYYGSSSQRRSFPLYSSTRPGSPAGGQWVGLQGRPFGSRSQQKIAVDHYDFRQPSNSKLLSRGGFGQSVRSYYGTKSSGGKGFSKGWGG